MAPKIGIATGSYLKRDNFRPTKNHPQAAKQLREGYIVVVNCEKRILLIVFRPSRVGLAYGK